MRSKRVIVFMIIAAVGLLVASALLLPPYTGPGVRGNLIVLEVAKARWWNDHKSGIEWPTRKDLRPYLTNGMPRSIHGEIYIVNKIGAPVYAFDPKTERLSSVSTTDSIAVKYYLEQNQWPARKDGANAVAQSSREASSPSDVTMQRFERLVADLTARGDTNTLAQVTSLIAARDVLTKTYDAGLAVALLHRLRSGRTNEVISVLETTLDGALTTLAFSPQEIGPDQIKILQMAREYRAKYPRTPSDGAAKAFELLDRLDRKTAKAFINP